MLQYSPSLLVYYNIIIMVFRNCCLAFVEGKLVCWSAGARGVVIMVAHGWFMVAVRF
jgi:hypothetical protein